MVQGLPSLQRDPRPFLVVGVVSGLCSSTSDTSSRDAGEGDAFPEPVTWHEAQMWTLAGNGLSQEQKLRTLRFQKVHVPGAATPSRPGVHRVAGQPRAEGGVGCPQSDPTRFQQEEEGRKNGQPGCVSEERPVPTAPVVFRGRRSRGLNVCPPSFIGKWG